MQCSAGGQRVFRAASDAMQVGDANGKAHTALPDVNTRDALKRKAEMRVNARGPGESRERLTKCAKDVLSSLLGRIHEQVVGSERIIAPIYAY